MHYHDIKPNKHLIMFIMHTMQILQTSVIRGSIAGQEDFYESDYKLYGQALSLSVFSLSLESSSGSTFAVRQVLVHVPTQLTHRQLNLQKYRSCRQVSDTSYTKLPVPMHL